MKQRSKVTLSGDLELILDIELVHDTPLYSLDLRQKSAQAKNDTPFAMLLSYLGYNMNGCGDREGSVIMFPLHLYALLSFP